MCVRLTDIIVPALRYMYVKFSADAFAWDISTLTHSSSCACVAELNLIRIVLVSVISSQIREHVVHYRGWSLALWSTCTIVNTVVKIPQMIGP